MVKKKTTKKKTAGKPGPKTAAGKARSLANLCPPWQKGQVTNPKGRPPGRSITKHLKKILDAPAASTPHIAPILRDMGLEPSEYTVGEALAYLNVLDVLRERTPRQMEMILDRVEGKPIQVIQNIGEDKKDVSALIAEMNSEDESK